jgi:hypothetical protein
MLNYKYNQIKMTKLKDYLIKIMMEKRLDKE